MPVAFILLNAKLGSEDEVLKDLRELSEVAEAYRVHGVYDAILKVSSDTTEQLKDSVSSKIRKHPEVKGTLTMVIME